MGGDPLVRLRPIARITGAVAILEGIATAWIFGFLLLEGTVSF